MINFLLEKEKEKETEKSNQRKLYVINTKSYRKTSEQKRKKIINSLNDPCNPYSALFYNNLLYNNYKVGMHYTDMEQGVPYLRIRKIKKRILPPIPQVKIIDERIVCNTYSGFNLNKKKNMIILQSNTNQTNKSGSIKKGNSNDKSDKKEKNKSNVLNQSYGDKNDFYNDDFELPKVSSENKSKNFRSTSRDKKTLSGIVEEE